MKSYKEYKNRGQERKIVNKQKYSSNIIKYIHTSSIHQNRISSNFLRHRIVSKNQSKALLIRGQSSALGSNQDQKLCWDTVRTVTQKANKNVVKNNTQFWRRQEKLTSKGIK